MYTAGNEEPRPISRKKVMISDAKKSKKQKPMDESNEMATGVKCYKIGQ